MACGLCVCDVCVLCVCGGVWCVCVWCVCVCGVCMSGVFLCVVCGVCVCARVSPTQKLAVTVRLAELSPAGSTKLVRCLPLPHVAPSNDGHTTLPNPNTPWTVENHSSDQTDYLLGELSCSRHGVVAGRLTSGRPGTVTPLSVSRTVLGVQALLHCYRQC